MENAGYIALSHQLVLQREMDVVAHNIANMNTPAYKAEKMIFREHIKEPVREESISFVQDFGMARDLSEVPITPTGNDLDLAISGSAYFGVQTQDGIRYTRHGRFQLDGQGRVVDGSGSTVLSAGGGPITVPVGSGKLTISNDGTLSGENGTIGQVGLFDFADEAKLKRAANGLYDPVDQPAQPATGSKMMQGMLEQSNVQAIIEMTRMIDIHRAYQATQQLVRSDHEQAIRAIGKLTSARQS